MDYEQLLAQYEDALDTILELELQIWELCCRNNQLQRTLDGLDSADPNSISPMNRTAPEVS